MSRTLHILSKSPIKVEICHEMAKFMSQKEGVPIFVNSITVDGGTDQNGRVVAQPFGKTTYTASASRIYSFIASKDPDQLAKIGTDDLLISFENGIVTNSDEGAMDFCVMSIHDQDSLTQYTSFGIQIDPALFYEYVNQRNVEVELGGNDITFGEFLSEKVRGVESNNWMKDIRFGNVDRKEQLRSCVNQFFFNRYAKYIPDFPRPGVMFKDITPIMTDPSLLSMVYKELKRVVEYNFDDVDYFAGLDARGFYFAPVLAQMLGKGFIPIRKAQKLPVTEAERSNPSSTAIIVESYSTEYSDDQFGLIPDKSYIGKNVLILDDLLATGGSIMGATKVLIGAKMNVLGALTVYDVSALRETAYKKVDVPDFKLMTLVRPNIEITSNLAKQSCFHHDTKKCSHQMTDIMIQRFRSPQHLDAEEIENDSIYDSTNSVDSSHPKGLPKLSRRYTLSSKDWVGDLEFQHKLDNVKVLYTDKDEDIARSIIRVLTSGPDCERTVTPKIGVKVKAGLFSNGESHAFIKQNIRNCHVFIVSRIRTGHINDDLMELYLIMDACNRSGVDKKTVIMPYYPYSRSDKKDAPRTHIGAAVQASFLTDLGVDNLISIDLHAGQIQGLISRGFHNLYLQNYLAEYIYANYLRYSPESEWNDRFVLIAPDAGSTKAIKSYSKIFEINNIALDKSRNYKAAEEGKSAVNKVRFIGDKEDFAGKVGLIIDDMGDTMGTMSAAVDTLVENGLDSAIVFVTHGVLSGPAMERINSNPHIREVVVSDSLPQHENRKLSPKLRVVSTAELLGRTIDGLLTGRSISRLFEE